jgi:hypothetical protein
MLSSFRLLRSLPACLNSHTAVSTFLQTREPSQKSLGALPNSVADPDDFGPDPTFKKNRDPTPEKNADPDPTFCLKIPVAYKTYL